MRGTPLGPDREGFRLSETCYDKRPERRTPAPRIATADRRPAGRPEPENNLSVIGDDMKTRIARLLFLPILIAFTAHAMASG